MLKSSFNFYLDSKTWKSLLHILNIQFVEDGSLCAITPMDALFLFNSCAAYVNIDRYIIDITDAINAECPQDCENDGSNIWNYDYSND